MSGMIFNYGTWQSKPDSVSISTINQSLIPAANGKPMLRRLIWGINGKIVTQDSGNPQSNVSQQIQDVAAAFNQNYQDIGFASLPNFYFRNSDTFGGIVVVRPFSFNNVQGAEGITYFRWSVAVEMNFLFREFVSGQVLNFSETMSFADNAGLPMYVERIPVFGLPIQQQISTSSWFYGSQRGMIEIAGEANAEPLAAIFPGNFRTSGGNARNIDYQSPRMFRGKGLSCVTTWNYNYISALPFFSYPNIVR